MRELLEQVKLNQQLKTIKEKYYHLMSEEEKSEFNSFFVEGPKLSPGASSGISDWVSGFIKRFTKKPAPDAPGTTTRMDTPPPADGKFDKKLDLDPSEFREVPPPKSTSTDLTPVPPKPEPKITAKDALVGGAVLGTAYGANQLLNRDRQDSKPAAPAAADAGMPAVDPMGNASPGTETDVSGTEFKPKPPVAEPPKFQGGADKAKEMQPSSEYEVKKGDNLWNIVKSRGKDMSDQDISKEVSRISSLNKMKNPDLILPGQKIKFNETTSLNKSLLDAFNDVINSKSPNIFAEAAKKNASEPKTEKEKKLAALAEPKDKITHKDVLVGRGVVKEEEQLDEAAFKLTDAHKKVITTHLNRSIGKGKVTFSSEHGGHFATHSDGIQSTVHHVQMKNGKLSLSHFMTMDEEVGFSEAELSHFSSIVEGVPVAPTPEDQAPTPTPKNKAEGGKGKGSLAEGRKKEEESLGDNMLHMNVKKAADNMANVKHKFANGETVNMTKGMAVGFLNRHSSAKTADQKDAILKHANKSFDAFKHITQGGAVPKEEAPKIKLGTMKGK